MRKSGNRRNTNRRSGKAAPEGGIFRIFKHSAAVLSRFGRREWFSSRRQHRPQLVRRCAQSVQVGGALTVVYPKQIKYIWQQQAVYMLEGVGTQMKKTKVLTSILAIAIILNCGVVALAAQHTEEPWGGTWNWGEKYVNDIKYAYSEYLLSASTAHNTNGIHKTTVVGKTTDTSDWTQPGTWAKSKVPCKWNYIDIVKNS